MGNPEGKQDQNQQKKSSEEQDPGLAAELRCQAHSLVAIERKLRKMRPSWGLEFVSGEMVVLPKPGKAVFPQTPSLSQK
jgi:hypothetical protein